MNIKTLIEFLDEYGLNGTYSGGGDSGGINEFSTEKPIRKEDKRVDMGELEDWVYGETLSEYGGWAWNGDASGYISYDKESKTIIVSGSETDDENLVEQKSVEFSLLGFFTEADKKRVDSVNIYISDYNDEETEKEIYKNMEGYHFLYMMVTAYVYQAREISKEHYEILKEYI